jgi:dipeptide/tripeptide permease
MAIFLTRSIPVLFVLLAAVFLLWSLRSGPNAVARRVRMRIALIFLVVGIGLLLLQTRSAFPEGEGETPRGETRRAR